LAYASVKLLFLKDRKWIIKLETIIGAIIALYENFRKAVGRPHLSKNSHLATAKRNKPINASAVETSAVKKYVELLLPRSTMVKVCTLKKQVCPHFNHLLFVKVIPYKCSIPIP
jgi:hypothetical protein